MAGAFTHMLVVGNAVEDFPVSSTFGDMLREHSNFLTLGSVSPDVPYLSLLSGGGKSHADVMHYHATNGIVTNGLHSLHASKSKDSAWRVKVVWLAGFISHLVVDATIHPIVESIVGPYTDEDVPDKHTKCEMTQDVLLFHDEVNVELTETEYTGIIKSCLEDDMMEEVGHFWSQLMLVNCPAAGEANTEILVSSYQKMLTSADGGLLRKLLRHTRLAPTYDAYDDILKDKTRVDEYYDNVLLPNGDRGPFKVEGYEYAVRNVRDAWRLYERALFSNENVTQIVPNWNLDTGIDQTTNTRTYWGDQNASA